MFALLTGSAAFAMSIALAAAPVCVGLGLPQGSDVVRPFGPTGEWSGHFGVDLAAPFGSSVVAAGAGTVSFVGTIAGRTSVTIHHGGDVRTSYSYLGAATVAFGETVTRGDKIGRSGKHGGTEAFHFSLRLGDRYVDPVSAFSCDPTPGRGLSLAGPSPTYAVARVRNPRRYFRSSARGPPGGRAHRI